MQQGEKIGHNVVHVVGDEHLVAVELDLVAVDGHALLDLREIEYAREIEGIVHVQVYPEHRIFVHRIQGVVEVQIVFVLEFRRGLGPERLNGVDDIVFFRFHLLAVFPFGLFAEDHRERHELAVFAQKRGDTALFRVFLVFVVDVQGYHGSAVCLLALLHAEFGIAFAAPFHRLLPFLPAERFDGDLLRHHECRVEAEAEVADYVLVFVFFQELPCRRERYLVDVAVHFFGGHAYAVVHDAQRFLLLVQLHLYAELAEFAFELSVGCQHLQFLACIHCICHEFTKEDFFVGIKELLDYGEYVFSRYPYFSC